MFSKLTLCLVTALTFTNGYELQSNNAFQNPFTSKPLKVLGFFPYNGYSHYVIFQSLMSEMAKRGHQVSVVSPFVPKKPQPNFNHIDLSDILPAKINDWTLEYMAKQQKNNIVQSMMRILDKLSGSQLCRDVLSHRKVQHIISGTYQYDILFTEIFGADCFLAIGHKLKIPTISISSSYSFPWTADYVGDIDNPSFVPNFYLQPSPDHLYTFGRRLQNSLLYLESKLSFYFYITRPTEHVMREFFGNDIPPLYQLRNNVSLVMVNTHESILGSKPTVPRILPIGGLHIQHPNMENIPEDIKTWLDASVDGVVYFSMGSILQAETLPKSMMETLLSAFNKLAPLRILWKLGPATKEIRERLSPNVKTADWLPQIEILSHPNTRAFFTHGGLMGLFEAVYTGVPMVGLPVYADQLENIFRAQKLGIAVFLDHSKLTQESIVNAIKNVTTNHSIRQRTQEVSKLFRDRPMSPLDSAIWWTEYVARHRGAPHLESLTAKMPLWKYVLSDVAAFLLVAALFIVFLFVFSTYLIVRNVSRVVSEWRHADKKQL